MTKSTVFYAFLTLVGGVSALELAASAAANGSPTCPFLNLNALNFVSSGNSILNGRRGPEAHVDPLWIDDFDIDMSEDAEQPFCAPDHAQFALALCVYFASVTTLYRRYQSNQALRNLVMTLCIGLPVLFGVLGGQSLEYISVAMVPFMAWAGLAAMPLMIWLIKHEGARELVS